MGEAKRRKQKDPFYGLVPKAGRGIVISRPVNIAGNGDLRIDGPLDPFELRRAVLFWDRLNLPKNNLVEFGLSPEEEFLKQAGLLSQIEIRRSFSGSMGKIYAAMHQEAFSKLEADEPGVWSMSEGPNSFQLEAGGAFAENRGALVELHRAIPIPDGDVPLELLLEFKEKRRDELRSLTLELDTLFTRVLSSSDTDFELKRAIREIDARCADVIAVGKESNIQFVLSDFDFGVSLDINSTNLLTSGALGTILGTYVGLPLVGGAIGVASSSIKFTASLGGKLKRSEKSRKLALSPYRAVSHLINEPI